MRPPCLLNGSAYLTLVTLFLILLCSPLPLAYLEITRYRKELQRMLHTRRKAEIEILSTAQVAPRAQGTGLMHTDMTQARNSDTNGKGSPPLLDYLLGKISRCIAEAM